MIFVFEILITFSILRMGNLLNIEIFLKILTFVHFSILFSVIMICLFECFVMKIRIIQII
ncbi:MAG: hypothetical protein AMS27_05560 [Bacteroides sp. SM23_62_1]|nr:MAG: hypothetical protein AMS27_05560 [Bacteroides sp. SM23_62_1]